MLLILKVIQLSSVDLVLVELELHIQTAIMQQVEEVVDMEVIQVYMMDMPVVVLASYTLRILHSTIQRVVY